MTVTSTVPRALGPTPTHTPAPAPAPAPASIPTPSKAFPLLSLPPELLLETLTYLPLRTLHSLILASRSFHNTLHPHLLTLERQRTSHLRLLISLLRCSPPTPLSTITAAVHRYTIDLSARSPYTDVSALHCATYCQRLDVMAWLLAQGMHVDVRDDYEWTPLHVAASEGWADGAKWLVANGADVDAVGGPARGEKQRRWGITKVVGHERRNGGQCFQWPRWPEGV
ncbi:hypothetical protein EDC01DRAFT_462919 [Geopyxis carbonaria]|nr:hypothetical protein EDC01DRAFT_462919 [Geopyxis carbonaria]